MITFKELKRNLKKDVSALPTLKVSLLGDTATQFLATAIKGEGIDFMEDDFHWHYGAVDEAKYKEAKESLKRHYEKRIARVEKEAK